MIIQCQACNTKFRVADDKVKPPGIKVRCSKCGEVFFYEFSTDIEEGSTSQEHFEDITAEETDAHVGNGHFSEATPDDTEGLIDQEADNGQEDNNISTEELISDTPPAEETNITTDFDSISSAELESIESNLENQEANDDLNQLSKEIMAAQIGTELPQEPAADNSSDDLSNLSIDKLDEMAQESLTEMKGEQEVIDDPVQGVNDQPVFDPPTSNNDNTQRAEGTDYKATSLVIDQDVLEQTHTKGTVSSSMSSSDSYNIKSSGNRPRAYSRKSKGGGFFKGFLKLFIGVVLFGALFISSMYVLNEMKLYENDYYNRFNAIAGNYINIGKDENVDLKKVRVLDEKGVWLNSKYGKVYVVSGEIQNRSDETINFVKLKVDYTSDGSRIFTQDVYAGNTISSWEIKNKPFNAIQTKLLRKKGDISYEDVSNLDGLNFDIQPGDKVPFYSIFPAQDKILGLKYRVKVLDFESSKVSKKP